MSWVALSRLQQLQRLNWGSFTPPRPQERKDFSAILSQDREESDPNAPRHLTEEEISQILENLLYTSGADEYSQELANYQKVLHIADQLRQEKFAPSVIPKIRQAILLQHEKSRAPPGLPVGIIAAAAVSAGATQSNLNSFHSSGTDRDVSSGVRIIQEIVNLPKERRNEICTVYLRQPIRNLLEAFQYESVFLETKIDDLLENPLTDVEILEVAEEPTPMWKRLENLLYYGGVDISSSYFLRLKLDLQTLARRKITPAQIRKKILDYTWGRDITGGKGVGKYLKQVLESKSSSLQEVVHIYHGSLNDAVQGKIFLDIHPLADQIVSSQFVEQFLMRGDNQELFFLESVVQPILSKIHLSGIPGLSKLYPATRTIWGAIPQEIKARPEVFPRSTLQERPELKDLIPRMWLLAYRKSAMEQVGFTFDSLREVLQHFGYEVYEIDDSFVYVVASAEESLDPQVRPGEVVASGIKKLIDKEHQYFAQKLAALESRKARSSAPQPLSESEQRILSLGRVICLEIVGSNLTEIFKISLVDICRTWSNNFHKMRSSFGIETSRLMMERELYDVTKGGNIYVDPHHIQLITDTLTNRGECFGINYAGANRSSRAVFSLAQLERANQVFCNGARIGSDESTANIATAIATGTLLPMGTSQAQLEEDAAEILRQRQQIHNGGMREALQSLHAGKGERRTSKDVPREAAPLQAPRGLPLAYHQQAPETSERSASIISPLLLETLQNLSLQGTLAQERISITPIAGGESSLGLGDYRLDFRPLLPRYLRRPLPQVWEQSWNLGDLSATPQSTLPSRWTAFWAGQ